jgi:membrane-associated protein
MDWIWKLKDFFSQLIDPQRLQVFVESHHHSIYLILFAIIFCETGLVVTPFLPGDSLLFTAGAVAAHGMLNPVWLFALLSLAAIAGDTANYWIGAKIGPRAFSGNVRFLKKEYLDRTHRFFEKYGGFAIIIGRFVPIVRTFAPFVAGIGAMNYARFIIYNIIGGVTWVALFVFGGYWFGALPFVKKNFEIVIVAIVLISVMPMVIEFLRARRERSRAE